MPGGDGMPAAPMKGLTPVAIPGIEAALAERRRAMIAKLERPHSRACVMTLLVGIEEMKDNQPAFDVVQQLAGKYPIRVIAVGRAEGADGGLAAWVNTECEGAESVAICTEEIVLQSSADAVDRVISAVRGSLVSELPVVLWWRGSVPSGNPLWTGLFALADRAIVDSHRFAFRHAGGDAKAVSSGRGHGPAAIKALRDLLREAGTRERAGSELAKNRAVAGGGRDLLRRPRDAGAATRHRPVRDHLRWRTRRRSAFGPGAVDGGLAAQ